MAMGGKQLADNLPRSLVVHTLHCTHERVFKPPEPCLFCTQVAERTAADKKGGHLARRKADGRLILRESAMCLDEDKAAFEDVSTHCFFNTNNLWVNLDSLKCAAPAADALEAALDRAPPGSQHAVQHQGRQPTPQKVARTQASQTADGA